ncbi:MAG: YigZ family protein [Bacillota bacterium]|nr:YigZ family protein [Bacillota bacterium]
MEYKTVKKEASAAFIERRSEFIGYIKPVQTEEEAVSFINEIRSRHHDATHNVYAYIIRYNNIRRYSDDGEPQGTAGMPVLDVLQKEGLTDVVIVVTRYFGGILLGGGGLVRAYSRGAKVAVDAAGIALMKKAFRAEIEVPYAFFSSLQREIAKHGGSIENTEFTDNVLIKFLIPIDELEKFNISIKDTSSGQYVAKIIGETYQAEDI